MSYLDVLNASHIHPGLRLVWVELHGPFIALHKHETFLVFKSDSSNKASAGGERETKFPLLLNPFKI